tara:strand:+ start:1211 stop:3250 length:2040 start_codon:yes stop_codon:yes gene_type:complete
MSFILTSQSNQVNSKPYNYQNYFSSTFKIEKNSLIALNHVTINRNAFFNFDEEKVLAFYHGVEMPGGKFYNMKDIKDSAGKKYALLRDETTTLTPAQLNNVCNYPQFVSVPIGSYSLDQLCQNLEQSMNNPTARNGGDFHVNGQWAITPVYNAENDFEHIDFTWETETRTSVPKEFPAEDDIFLHYPDYNDVTYLSDGLGAYEFTETSGTTYGAVEVYRYLKHTRADGITYGNVKGDGCVVGLSRVTGGVKYRDFGRNKYFDNTEYSNDGSNDIPFEIGFFDVCVAVVDGFYVLYQLECHSESTKTDGGNGPYHYRMFEYDLPAPIQIGGTNEVEFYVDGNNIEVVINHLTGTEKVTLVLNPTNNNTYQLIPKILLSKSAVITLPKGKEPSLLSNVIIPRIPLIKANGDLDFTMCNVGWIVNNYWEMNALDYQGAKFVSSNDYLKINRSKFFTWSTCKPDFDSTRVSTLGQTLTIAQVKQFKYWWSYLFDPTLNANAGGFKYNYQLFTATPTLKYLYTSRGTVLIPYSNMKKFYHCNATLDGVIGITPGYKKGISVASVAVPADFVVQILGSDRIALTSNDLLYVRIDLGNTYSINGSTSMISSIISPIITQRDSADVGTNLGIRTYTPPERMYLKLNNSEDIYINSINVSIVRLSEEFANELAPTTSASFHIIQESQR